MFFSRRFWARGKEKTKACLARVEGPGQDTSSCAPVLTGAPCQVPSSPLEPKAFALGGHQHDAICLMFLLGETDGGQEALFFFTLT